MIMFYKIIILFRVILRSLRAKFIFNYSKEFTIYSNIKNYLIHSSFVLRLLITQKNKNVIISNFFNKKIKYKTKDNQIFFLSLYCILPKKFAWDLYLNQMIFKIKENSVIVDIGAHFGFFGCRGAYLTSACKWYFIECDPNNYAILKKNIASLNKDNIFLSKTAIADKDDTLEFMVGDSSTTGSIKSSNFFLQNTKNKIEIQATTFEKFLQLKNIKNIDLLKVDIEGSEYLAFEKNLDVLKKVKSVIFELHMCNNILPENTKLYEYLKTNFNTKEIYPSSSHGKKLIEIYGTK